MRKISYVFYFLLAARYFFKPKKLIKDFCNWSKTAEWTDGETKSAFIDNDWIKYFKLFLKSRRKNYNP